MSYNYLDKTGLALVWEKIKNALSGKVDKVDGKGLSTNDYTSTEKTKLSGIASGAQVNVLEGIQKNGTNVTITNKIANITVPTATSDLTNDSGFITTSDIPEGAAASTTTPKMDGTATVGSELAFARGDHIHPTDTSRASASDVTTLSGRVDDLETAVGTGGSVDSKIATAIQGLDSSIAATTNQAISSVTIVDGMITNSTKITVPTNNNQLTNGAGYQTASDVATAISDKADSATTLAGYGITDAYTKTETGTQITNAIGELDSSITATSNQAISAVTVTDGKITASSKITVPTNTNQLTNGAGFQTASDVATAISSAITTVMDYKGTVATVANLPASGNKNGDVYHVTATDGEYAWNGTEWEELGSTIDLSGYVEDTEMVAITSTEINTICV